MKDYSYLQIRLGRQLRVLLFVYLLSEAPFSISVAQDSSNGGFARLEGEYVSVITDLPSSNELQQLPMVFDTAMPTWCEYFDTSAQRVRKWHVDAHIMLERARFESAGLIPPEIAQFPYGFQYGDRVWVVEQPSEYYRRHLLLHEGTHWFMNKRFGGNGPPWLMEGFAEWLGTHRWDGKSLEMGIIPKTRDEVPYWGRILLIKQQLAEGVAPSLETILRYDGRAHQQVEAYAWSWAVVVFLMHHPDSQAAFRNMLKEPMRSDMTLTRWLFEHTQHSWPRLRAAWCAFLSDLDYGYDMSLPLLQLSEAPKKLASPQVFELQTNLSWQPTGIKVEKGQHVSIHCDGHYTVVASDSNLDTPAWESTAAGVTLEYHNGRPLGELTMAIASPFEQEQAFSAPLDSMAVGTMLNLSAPQSGEIVFRVNELQGDLTDNQGVLQIAIAP
ncbi:MAG: hypothetical protein KDB03_21210 [Planctomycetales bacterium]|nr:hypothetical protein [Planctomycetales bacterium]